MVSGIIVLVIALLGIYLWPKEVEKNSKSVLGDGICDIEKERGTDDCYTFPSYEYEIWRTDCEDTNQGVSQEISCNTKEIKEPFDSGKKVFYCCTK